MPKFLVLQEVGAQISQSGTTTSENWGIDRILLDFSSWSETPLIQYFLKVFKEQSSKIVKKGINSEILYFALEQAWIYDDLTNHERDRDGTWALLERAFDLALNDGSTHHTLTSQLGFVACNQEQVGNAKHLEVNRKIAKFLENVIAKGFDILRGSANLDEKKALNELESFLAHQGILEASEFSANPYAILYKYHRYT